MGTRSILECFYDAAALSTGKHSCFTMGLGSCGKYLQGFLLSSLGIPPGKDTGLIQSIQKPGAEAMEKAQAHNYSEIQGQTRSLEGLAYSEL